MSKLIKLPVNSRHGGPAASSARKEKTPSAPPAYRPQPTPKVLQRKTTPLPQAHVRGMKPVPAAPPVYRPQPTPKVLQRKAAQGSQQPEAKSVGKAAPPVYRPQRLPKASQPKAAAILQPVAQKKSTPQAPPVYRPQPPPKCLQPKMAGGQPRAGESPRRPVAPPVYRPQTKKPIQPKTGALIQPPLRRGRENQVVQRLIITKDLDKDVEYAKVKRFLVEKADVKDVVAAPGDEVNITEKNANEPLYILQHGGQPHKNSPGTIMGWSPEELLEKIKKMGFDPEKHVGKIQLLSCYSGLNMPGKKTDESFAARFSQLLKQKGYKGTVSGVTGSLNPLGIGKPNEPVEVEHLWQGDPIYTLMQEINSDVNLRHSETLYTIQDYISGDANEPDKGWKAKLKIFVGDAIDAIEICDQMVKMLGGFEEFKPLLNKWREQFFKVVNDVYQLANTKEDVKVSELKNKDDLNEKLGDVLSALTDYRDLMGDYVEKRTKQGYKKGFLDMIFKPLQLVEY